MLSRLLRTSQACKSSVHPLSLRSFDASNSWPPRCFRFRMWSMVKVKEAPRLGASSLLMFPGISFLLPLRQSWKCRRAPPDSSAQHRSSVATSAQRSRSDALQRPGRPRFSSFWLVRFAGANEGGVQTYGWVPSWLQSRFSVMEIQPRSPDVPLNPWTWLFYCCSSSVQRDDLGHELINTPVTSRPRDVPEVTRLEGKSPFSSVTVKYSTGCSKTSEQARQKFFSFKFY